jgi:hypothetical protein
MNVLCQDRPHIDPPSRTGWGIRITSRSCGRGQGIPPGVPTHLGVHLPGPVPCTPPSPAPLPQGGHTPAPPGRTFPVPVRRPCPHGRGYTPWVARCVCLAGVFQGYAKSQEVTQERCCRGNADRASSVRSIGSGVTPHAPSPLNRSPVALHRHRYPYSRSSQERMITQHCARRCA